MSDDGIAPMREGPRAVRVRVGGLVFAGDRLLVVEHELDGVRWHCFPGGALEPGETPEQCIRRELREELDLSCDVGRLVALGFFLDETTHSVELFFECSAEESVLVPRCATIVSCQFVDRAQLPHLRVFPLELSTTLAASSAGDLRQVRYYGRFA